MQPLSTGSSSTSASIYSAPASFFLVFRTQMRPLLYMCLTNHFYTTRFPDCGQSLISAHFLGSSKQSFLCVRQWNFWWSLLHGNETRFVGWSNISTERFNKRHCSRKLYVVRPGNAFLLPQASYAGSEFCNTLLVVRCDGRCTGKQESPCKSRNGESRNGELCVLNLDDHRIQHNKHAMPGAIERDTFQKPIGQIRNLSAFLQTSLVLASGTRLNFFKPAGGLQRMDTVLMKTWLKSGEDAFLFYFCLPASVKDAAPLTCSSRPCHSGRIC